MLHHLLNVVGKSRMGPCTWMTRNPAPDSVLHVIHCGCKGACETGRCSCFSAGLCYTDLCRCCNCANTKETEELEDNSPDTDSEDWVSLICYFLFSFVQFYISYFIFFIKIVFMVHQCCFHLWMNEWTNEQMVIGISTITAFYWYKEGGFFVRYIEILT